jgi:hypothetical protein
MKENEKDQKQEEESQDRSKWKEGCRREVGRDGGEKHEQILDRKESKKESKELR